MHWVVLWYSIADADMHVNSDGVEHIDDDVNRVEFENPDPVVVAHWHSFFFSYGHTTAHRKLEQL